MAQVEIVEMGPRDGLQNEARIIPTAEKVALIDLLSGCGYQRIEVASFVSPKWVPQMADGAEVLAAITRTPGLRYTALTPNSKGLAGALAARVDEVAVFGAASEGFSKANLNATIAESLERFKPVVQDAREAGVPVRGYVSCVTDCPFDGPTNPSNVARVTDALLEMGCFEVSLGETLGRGSVEAVKAMLDKVVPVAAPERLAGHFHDTGGVALANIEVALDAGLRVFDASVGGLGGCPYAPGAAGNVATEAVIAFVEEKGFDTGLDAARVAEAGRFARRLKEGA